MVTEGVHHMGPPCEVCQKDPEESPARFGRRDLYFDAEPGTIAHDRGFTTGRVCEVDVDTFHITKENLMKMSPSELHKLSSREQQE